ncbi:metallophosphoesterase [candidate division WWE3 bacterium]|jgi:predicted phosphodiesterase|uniref:Metallophosphoesterase n=1 Tax=candidate division WWE3 bacterium TaxID=2053526 RepID=A0A3A4ZG47_UNCKA|nr:MAG: metallophosphoesterase [candidate division WWE3 bacterium]
MSKAKRKSSGNTFLFRLLRSFMAIVVLTGFVLGISFFIKGLANADSGKVLSYIRPLLAKLNISDEEIGQVAGKFVSREDAGESQDDVSAEEEENKSADKLAHTQDEVLIKLAVMSDTHNDFENLRSALSDAKEKGIGNVFFLGDFTELGLTEDLEDAKEIMEGGGIDYLAIPGDHDLWKTVGPENFLTIFKKNNHTVTLNGVKFVLLDNSANYTLIDDETISWFQKEIADADFVLLSQPLYHPTLQVVMGVVNGEEQSEVKSQAGQLLAMIRSSGVRAVIAGDQHASSTNDDPERSGLKHIVVGALTDDRNLQSPRYSVLDVYLDMDFDIKDVVLE